MQMPPRFLPKYATTVQPPPPREASGYRGYQGYDTTSAPVQSVSEILSQPLGEVPPDLRGATGTASRQREIADMLMQGAQQQDNTSIAGGLSSLGQAFIARRAGKKADAAEAKRNEIVSMLTQKAMQGDQASIAALLSPEAAIGRMDQQARYGVEDKFAQAGIDLQSRSLDQSADQFGQTMGLQRDQFGHTVTQADVENDLAQQSLDIQRSSAQNSANSAAGYGLNGVWGWDEANSRPVYMQPSKDGGLRQAETPDGVTLLDPYNTSYDRKLGTLAATAEGDKNPALLGVEAAEADMARLSEQIDLAITQTNDKNTGFWGQFNVTATDLAATLKTVRASGAFTSLVNLKAQGGTLGALSDTELQLLEAKIANVERSQSQEQIDRNLLELKNALQGSATRIRAAYEKEYAAGRYGTGRRGDGGAGRVVEGFSGPLSGGKVGPSGDPVPEGFE